MKINYCLNCFFCIIIFKIIWTKITFGGALRIWMVSSPSSKVIASPSSILIIMIMIIMIIDDQMGDTVATTTPATRRRMRQRARRCPGTGPSSWSWSWLSSSSSSPSSSLSLWLSCQLIESSIISLCQRLYVLGPEYLIHGRHSICYIKIFSFLRFVMFRL